MGDPQTPLLEIAALEKQFPGVRALHDVDLTLNRGEVLAVVGENGAGKSTLMKILAGVHTPNAGTIRIDGTEVRIQSVRDAQAHGIALIHQELNLAANLDIAANIFLGIEPHTAGFIDSGQIHAKAASHLKRVGLDFPTDTLVEDLTIGHQQLVEIAKALSVDARIIIMDEPTSSLSQTESERLFKVVHDLRSQGISIIYISHRLGEVMELADRVTILRDGENAGELAGEQISHNAMVKLMVGRDLSQFYQRNTTEPGSVLLEAENLRTPAHPRSGLSFSVREGEIVGGTLKIAGKVIHPKTPLEAIQSGIVLAPEDRKQHGLILEMSVRENASLPRLRMDQKAGAIDFGAEIEVATEMVKKMDIKTPGLEQVVQYLSGGNQQKMVLGKWLAMKPRLLLLDEPTRGIDVGSKQEIYRLMEELTAGGVAILFVSSEMEEVLGMADRALVMHEGVITGELARDQLNEEAVMQLATGNKAAA
jgi:ribose transport system ATP-binding protein